MYDEYDSTRRRLVAFSATARPLGGPHKMAPGHDEVDTADELEALPFTSITMSAYELHPKVRRALCMHHTMSPPFAPH